MVLYMYEGGLLDEKEKEDVLYNYARWESKGSIFIF